MDVQDLAKYNDNYRYLLTVIDIFSKFLNIVQLRSKTGTLVPSVFRWIFKDPKYSKPIRRRPIWVRTDRDKEFLNTSFRDMLKKEGIQFQACKDPNMKCAIGEMSHRTLCENCTNISPIKIRRYLDVLPKFVKA